MMPFERFLYSLVLLLVFLSFCGQGIVIDVRSVIIIISLHAGL